MQLSDLLALLCVVGLIVFTYGAKAFTRRLTEKALSDDLCRKLKCKALPVRLWTGGIRLVIERTRFAGVLTIEGGGSVIDFGGLMSHAVPIVHLLTRGTEAALARFLSKYPAVSIGTTSFERRFVVHAPSASAAEVAFPPRLRDAFERLVADVEAELELPHVEGFGAMLRAAVKYVDWHRRSSSGSDEYVCPLNLAIGGNTFGLRVWSKERALFDDISRILALLEALVVASAPLERQFDKRHCRYCDDQYTDIPKRDCERCGATYHEVCFDHARGCPVWGCGDREQQIQAICDAYGRLGAGDYSLWKRGQGLGESPRAPDD